MDYTPPLGSTDPNEPYSDGNIAFGLKGSRPPAKSWNDIYAELLNVIDTAGLTRDGNDLTQLAAAVQMLANFNIASLTEEAAIETGDFLPFFDVDNGDERKLTAASLLSRFMGGRMVIAADANWNTLVTPGMYNTTGSAYSNAPLGASAHPGTLWIIGRSQSANHATQLFFYSAAVPAIWMRTTTDGGANWSGWKQVGAPAAGTVIQRRVTQIKTVISGSTATPYDDTIPQITEGTEIVADSITPLYANSKIRARLIGFLSCANAGQEGIFHLHKNGATDAAYGQVMKLDLNAEDCGSFYVEFELDAEDLTAKLLAMRFGRQGGAAFYINGITTGRRLGGVAAMTYILEEIKQ